MNRDKARELLEKELRIRPTVKASAIFTGKNGSMGFRAGRFYAVTIVKRKGEVVLIAPDDGLKCPYIKTTGDNNVRCVRQGRELSREEIAGIFDPDEEGGGQE